MEGIREAYQRVDEIDVVVTSAGGHWRTRCSRLHEMYQETELAELQRLKSQDCLGDLMWRPLGPNGPIELKTGIRAMTLIELNDLPNLIARDKWALLVLGPCVTCGKPKTEMLRAVLELPRHLITDLVVDSVTARVVLSLVHG
jgi:DNA-binding transcriptional regulator LsrR (DeoR family)